MRIKNLIEQRLRISLISMLTFSLFLIQIIIGIISNSLSVIAISLHLWTDTTSFLIALFMVDHEINISKKSANKNSFRDSYKGFNPIRGEILGNLINSIFIFSISTMILIESFEKFFSPKMTENALLISIIGGAQIPLDLLRLCFFRFSRIGENNNYNYYHTCKNNNLSSFHHPPIITNQQGESGKGKAEKMLNIINLNVNGDERKTKMHLYNRRMDYFETTIWSVFLHFLVDIFHSTLVLLCGLIYYFLDFPGIELVDPIVTVSIILTSLSSKWPLALESSIILLQSSPKNLDEEELKTDLAGQVKEILKINRLKIFYLPGENAEALTQITFLNSLDYKNSRDSIYNFFHSFGIYLLTIEPDFQDEDNLEITMRDLISRKNEERIPLLGLGNSPPSITNSASTTLLSENDEKIPRDTKISNLIIPKPRARTIFPGKILNNEQHHVRQRDLSLIETIERNIRKRSEPELAEDEDSMRLRDSSSSSGSGDVFIVQNGNPINHQISSSIA